MVNAVQLVGPTVKNHVSNNFGTRKYNSVGISNVEDTSRYRVPISGHNFYLFQLASVKSDCRRARISRTKFV